MLAEVPRIPRATQSTAPTFDGLSVAPAPRLYRLSDLSQILHVADFKMIIGMFVVLRSDADPIDDLLPYNWVDSRAAASAVIDQAA
ncbi:hypothetical protein [Sphingobium sp. KCTC 72723]|uniref:hypothetical protein n=1 Tax=Sphingobium sp. KCTC 72723 TaxID=2733867 RepID=UPI00165E631D|nr:hypothetical protein [Sphingobium sp. KCTC 72723]